MLIFNYKLIELGKINIPMDHAIARYSSTSNLSQIIVKNYFCFCEKCVKKFFIELAKQVIQQF